ncbi:WYL domain-containing protein [Luteibacter sp. dw_328]|uniref:helix-turn-helix transcriptional regulator n=1 Tax=Luteibacter sp. dw_328 TaxID=2719796 RepID=UPI001BD355EF
MSTATNDTIWRQWTLLRLIPRAPWRTTASDLRGSLSRQGIEVTRRTVERDLQTLSVRFPLVADESSKPFGWYWARDANFEFTPKLSVSQGIALLLAQLHLRTLMPDSLMHELAPIFDMANQELAAGAWNEWHRRTAVIPSALALLPPAIDRCVLRDVHEALATRRQLIAGYRSKGASDVRDLTIHPLGLLVRGSVQYLVCTLFDYADIRQLALHRLSDTRPTHDTARVPVGFVFSTYARVAAKYESQGEIRLVAHFTPEAAEHLRETPLSADQTITDLPAIRRVAVTATVESDQTLRWWLKAFGSGVEVREPVALRDELLEEARKTVFNYVGA